jgi:hypothetical protein
LKGTGGIFTVYLQERGVSYGPEDLVNKTRSLMYSVHSVSKILSYGYNLGVDEQMCIVFIPN